MNTQARVKNAVVRAVDELNQLLPRDRRLPPSDDTALLGPDGGLDSLGLVNLIVLMERTVAQEFDIAVCRWPTRWRNPTRRVRFNR